MEYYVAKSYETWPRLCEPYETNGKMYVKVRSPRGVEKTVRAYTKPQSAAPTKNGAVEVIQPAKSRKEVLGFGEAGYIWIFKGKTSNAIYEALEWFKLSPCRYTRLWGWYLPSDIEMPDPLPASVEPIKLYWDEVSLNDVLIADKDIVSIVDEKLYDPSPSKWVGQVGDRLTDLVLTCTKAVEVESMYGSSMFFVFTDENENVYTWGTQAKRLEEGHTYIMSGTIKSLENYRGTKQNNLSRCTVKEEV